MSRLANAKQTSIARRLRLSSSSSSFLFFSRGGGGWRYAFGRAGGYDERVAENVEHLEELKQRARELGLEDLVDFRLNVADGVFSLLSYYY